MTVFLDTVGLLALWDESDQWHDASQSCFSQLLAGRADLITSTFVLLVPVSSRCHPGVSPHYFHFLASAIQRRHFSAISKKSELLAKLFPSVSVSRTFLSVRSYTNSLVAAFPSVKSVSSVVNLIFPVSLHIACALWHRQFIPALQCHIQEPRNFSKVFPLRFREPDIPVCSLLFKILRSGSPMLPLRLSRTVDIDALMR